MELNNKQTVNVPLDELKKTINVLRYAAHPYPSPHADYWEDFLTKPAVQHLGKPAGYVTARTLDKLEKHPMSTVCMDGFAMYKDSIPLYRHPK